MTGSHVFFDRIGTYCLRQSHLPRGLLVPIILVPSQLGLPAGTRIVEGVISGG